MRLFLCSLALAASVRLEPRSPLLQRASGSRSRHPLLVQESPPPPTETDTDTDAPLSSTPVGTVMSTAFGAGKGKRIAWGLLKQDVLDSELPSEEEQAARRAKAAAELTNIDGDERDRRQLAGLGLGAVTLAVAAGMLVGHVDASGRAALFPFVSLTLGYLASALEGL